MLGLIQQHGLPRTGCTRQPDQLREFCRGKVLKAKLRRLYAQG